MKIIFISRAFPPVVGGIEMQNFGISEALSKISDVKIIANKKGKSGLPLFLLRLIFRETFIVKNYDAVLFGDGVLSPVGAFWKILYPKKKFLSVIHGLDITYAHKKGLMSKIYKFVNIPCHKKLDKLIMVGNETIAEAVKIGIPKEKCVFIPNGLDPKEICEIHSREEMEELLNISLSDKKLIFRGGRFVKHKGVEWFIRNVVPKLPENYIFVAAGPIVGNKTAGDESYFEHSEKAVAELNLQNRVQLLSKLNRAEIKILFNACDLYVSPNIKVPGTMEGFGITAIEAGACGQVVLASNLEGLKDAIIDGENGFLVESENAAAWMAKISELLADDNFRKEFGEKAARYVKENYSWEIIAKKYLSEIEKVVQK
jgi:glycosyltransferase involved in cell wall biosynthesis